MKIRVTKVFANYLNKLAKQGILDIDHAEVFNCCEKAYRMMVGSVYDAEDFNDWEIDEFGGVVYKAIRVVYPCEHHACDIYLSTKRLNSEFTRRNVKDEAGLKRMLVDMVNI